MKGQRRPELQHILKLTTGATPHLLDLQSYDWLLRGSSAYLLYPARTTVRVVKRVRGRHGGSQTESSQL